MHKQNRIKILEALYNMANANPKTPVLKHKISKAVDLSEADFEASFNYLVDKGLILFVTNSSQASITAPGIDFYEDSQEQVRMINETENNNLNSYSRHTDMSAPSYSGRGGSGHDELI